MTGIQLRNQANKLMGNNEGIRVFLICFPKMGRSEAKMKPDKTAISMLAQNKVLDGDFLNPAGHGMWDIT
jgi:hypothetical protein